MPTFEAIIRLRDSGSYTDPTAAWSGEVGVVYVDMSAPTDAIGGSGTYKCTITLEPEPESDPSEDDEPTLVDDL